MDTMSEHTADPAAFVKNDSAKVRWDYMPWEVVNEIRHGQLLLLTGDMPPVTEASLFHNAMCCLTAHHFAQDKEPHSGFSAVTMAAVWLLQLHGVRTYSGGNPMTGVPGLDTSWALVPWRTLQDVAQAFHHGAVKYGANNFRKGADHGRYFSACMRHMTAFAGGEIVDPDSGNYHLAHAVASLFILRALQLAGTGEDTRFWAAR